jgi:hypothetical protein
MSSSAKCLRSKEQADEQKTAQRSFGFLIIGQFPDVKAPDVRREAEEDWGR